MNIHAKKIAEILYKKVDKVASWKLLSNIKDTADRVTSALIFNFPRDIRKKEDIELEDLSKLQDDVYYALVGMLSARQQKVAQKILQKVTAKSSDYLVILADEPNFFENMLDLYGEPDEYNILLMGNTYLGDFVGEVPFYFARLVFGEISTIRKGTVRLYTSPYSDKYVDITGVRRNYHVMASKPLAGEFTRPLKAILKGKEYTLKTVKDLQDIFYKALEILGSRKTRVEQINIYINSEDIEDRIIEELKKEFSTEKSPLIDLVVGYKRIGKLIERL